MTYLELAKKIQAEIAVCPANKPSIDLTEGRIIAVLTDSPIVGPVWFALDDGFKSDAETPVFFVSELPHLQKMDAAEFKRRYELKRTFGGGWIREKNETIKKQ